MSIFLAVFTNTENVYNSHSIYTQTHAFKKYKWLICMSLLSFSTKCVTEQKLIWLNTEF